MVKHESYIGKLKDVAGVWCDHKPRGLKVEETVIWYSADEGMVFTKDGELFDSVVLKDGETIEQYIEIKDPRKPVEE